MFKDIFKETSDTGYSMVRFCTFIIVVTCCIVVLGAGFLGVTQPENSSAISNIAIIVLPVLGAGLGAKVWQRKYEEQDKNV